MSEAFGQGHRSALVVLPTGTGKTVVFAELARRTVEQGGRVLVLAHRTELLEQAGAKLRSVGIEPGLEQGGSRAAAERVVLASVQTLRGARLARLAQDGFGLIVIDEAHHATAAGYRAILDALPAAKVLGVTATPDRLDGEALGKVFATVAARYELRDAIRDGWLSRIEAQRVRVEVDLDRVHTRAGDFDQRELAAEYMTEQAIRGVVEPLEKVAGDRRTILFSVTVEHAEALALHLNVRAPGTARAVSGQTPAAERAEVVARFRRGELRTLVNCALYTEGFDCPEVEVVAIARPTKSRALFAQMVGRGTRLAPGKDACLVLDFCGNSKRHKLIGPADLLAGSEDPPDVLERAHELGGDVDQALDQARAEAAERARASSSNEVRRYVIEAVDLFGTQLDLRFDDGQAATERQREVLERAGLPAPEKLSRKAASGLIDLLVQRRQLGLCTFKQARLLRRNGIDARTMTMEQAGKAIGDLKSRWSGASSRHGMPYLDAFVKQCRDRRTP